MAAPQTAAQRTLNITELLEQILLGLPPKRILIFQRVNKMFKATIDNSTPIQQALWFKHPPSSADTTSKYTFPNTNPLLRDLPFLGLRSNFLYPSIVVKISSEGLRRIKDRASFAQMLVWDQCREHTYLQLLVFEDSSGVEWRNLLEIKHGGIGMTSPTVRDIAELVLKHESTASCEEEEWRIKILRPLLIPRAVHDRAWETCTINS